MNVDDNESCRRELVRLGRGLFQDPARAGEDIAHDLAEAARPVPSSVVSLVSALRHHELTTHMPHAVWMPIPHKARTPSPRTVHLEVVRATGPALTASVERVLIEGVEVTVYGVAKTIADCFKHRKHVGEDVAIEALRDALLQRKTTVGDLMQYSAIDRVTKRMAPYVRALQCRPDRPGIRVYPSGSAFSITRQLLGLREGYGTNGPEGRRVRS